jgi:hypothetical protein
MGHQQPLNVGTSKFRLDAREREDAFSGVRMNGTLLGQKLLSLRINLWFCAPRLVVYLGPVFIPGSVALRWGARLGDGLAGRLLVAHMELLPH